MGDTGDVTGTAGRAARLRFCQNDRTLASARRSIRYHEAIANAPVIAMTTTMSDQSGMLGSSRTTACCTGNAHRYVPYEKSPNRPTRRMTGADRRPSDSTMIGTATHPKLTPTSRETVPLASHARPTGRSTQRGRRTTGRWAQTAPTAKKTIAAASSLTGLSGVSQNTSPRAIASPAKISGVARCARHRTARMTSPTASTKR